MTTNRQQRSPYHTLWPNEDTWAAAARLSMAMATPPVASKYAKPPTLQVMTQIKLKVDQEGGADGSWRHRGQVA